MGQGVLSHPIPAATAQRLVDDMVKRGQPVPSGAADRRPRRVDGPIAGGLSEVPVRW